MFKLGKTPARPDAVKFKFRQFADSAKLPKPPKQFGHETVVDTDDWGMLGNDNYGDCVWAGAAHEHLMWGRVGGQHPRFDDHAVLANYTEVTGFNPNDPSTDNGTDMAEAASYRRKTGLLDADGNRHKIVAYLALDPGNTKELYQALYLFEAVGVGIGFPATAWDQFKKHKPWTVVPRAKTPTDGHYIPLVAKRRSLMCITWGVPQLLSLGFLHRYCDEAIAYVTDEMMTANKSPEGFDVAGLQAALGALGH